MAEMGFKEASTDLLSALEGTREMLEVIHDHDASLRPAPGKWSPKEIIGHLIDSAMHNHQRFVRAATQGGVVSPGYDQNALVALQHPNDVPWELLVRLWSAYNRYLAHVLSQIPDSAAGVQCTIGNNAPVTLLWLAQDYVAHLRNHLEQVRRAVARA